MKFDFILFGGTPWGRGPLQDLKVENLLKKDILLSQSETINGLVAKSFTEGKEVSFTLREKNILL